MPKLPGSKALLLAILAVTAVLLAAGCNDEDESGSAADSTEATADAAADQQSSRRQRFAAVERKLAEVDRGVPAQEDANEFRTSGQVAPATMDAFLTDVFGSIHQYWMRTLSAENKPAPKVSNLWLGPGETKQTACVNADGSPGIADDTAAFYCPGDDTIYMSQKLASDVWNGIAQGFPGQNAGQGRAIGDFGVALIVAHEYAHNVQHEAGSYKNFSPATDRPFELQADCLAGTWANSVYFEGRLEAGDVEEGISTTLAVGDFDTNEVEHHGTPAERREALLNGYNNGAPSFCNAYLNLDR